MRTVKKRMRAQSFSGAHLGRVVKIGKDRFLVERGWLLPRTYVAERKDIVAFGEGYLVLAVAELPELAGEFAAKGESDVFLEG
jgi:hypothetical protein